MSSFSRSEEEQRNCISSGEGAFAARELLGAVEIDGCWFRWIYSAVQKCAENQCMLIFFIFKRKRSESLKISSTWQGVWSQFWWTKVHVIASVRFAGIVYWARSSYLFPRNEHFLHLYSQFEVRTFVDTSSTLSFWAAIPTDRYWRSTGQKRADVQNFVGSWVFDAVIVGLSGTLNFLSYNPSWAHS